MALDADNSLFWRGVLMVGALLGYATTVRGLAVSYLAIDWPTISVEGSILPSAATTWTTAVVLGAAVGGGLARMLEQPEQSDTRRHWLLPLAACLASPVAFVCVWYLLNPWGRTYWTATETFGAVGAAAALVASLAWVGLRALFVETRSRRASEAQTALDRGLELLRDGEFDEAVEPLQRARTALRKLDSRMNGTRLSVELLLGVALTGRDRERAVDAIDAALAQLEDFLARSNQPRPGLARTGAHAAAHGGRFERACDLSARAADMHERLGDAEKAAARRREAAEWASLRGELSQAAEWLDGLLDDDRLSDELRAEALSTRAITEHRRRNLDRADELYERAESTWPAPDSEAHDAAEHAMHLSNWSVLLARRGDHERAATLDERAFEILDRDLDEGEDRPFVFYLNRARVHWHSGDLDAALDSARRAESSFRDSAFPDHHSTVARLHLLLAKLHRERGDLDRARRAAGKGLDGLETLDPPETPWLDEARTLAAELDEPSD